MKKIIAVLVVLATAQFALAFPSDSITCGGLETVGDSPAVQIEMKFNFETNLLTVSFPGNPSLEPEETSISKVVSDLNKVAVANPSCASVENFTIQTVGDFSFYKFGADVSCGDSSGHYKLETYCQ